MVRWAAPGSEDSPVCKWELKVSQPSEFNRRDARLRPIREVAVSGSLTSTIVCPAAVKAATVVFIPRATAGVGGTTPEGLHVSERGAG